MWVNGCKDGRKADHHKPTCTNMTTQRKRLSFLGLICKVANHKRQMEKPYVNTAQVDLQNDDGQTWEVGEISWL